MRRLRGRGRVLSKFYSFVFLGFLVFFFFALRVYVCFFFFLFRFVPRYFDKDLEKGYADLTDEGRAAVEEEMKEDTGFCIEGIDTKATLAA